MRYRSTQVYLEPEQHARLKAEAAQRGISLAELMRLLAAAHVGEHAPAYGDKTWDAIIGLTGDDTPTDIAGEHDRYARDAADASYDKKTGAARKRARKRAQ
ncbi:MAG TPA: CopG family transcriptional regulator [Actinomycetota bacterium]